MAEYNEEKMIKSMKFLEAAVSNIQKGFLYNSPELIKQGAEDIIQCSSRDCFANTEDVQQMLPKNKKLMRNAAVLSSKRMEISAVELAFYAEQRQMSEAFDAFSGIQKACMDCHRLVRNW